MVEEQALGAAGTMNDDGHASTNAHASVHDPFAFEVDDEDAESAEAPPIRKQKSPTPAAAKR